MGVLEEELEASSQSFLLFFCFTVSVSLNERGGPVVPLCACHAQLRGQVRGLEEELESSHFELAALKAKHMEKMTRLKELEQANVQLEHKNKSLQV